MLYLKHYTVICLLINLIEYVISDCPFPKKNMVNGGYIYQSPRDVNLTVAPEKYVLRFGCYRGFVRKGSWKTICNSSKWTRNVPRCLKMECIYPPKIPNGHYELHSDSSSTLAIGTTAIYTCDLGYELENSKNSALICTFYSDINDVKWKGETPMCIEKENCPDPGLSPDGNRNGNCCSIGDVLKYFCNDDFELVGDDKIECLHGGIWSAPRPLCKPRNDHCNLPPSIPYGVAKGEKKGDYYRPYDKVEILCKPGYHYNGSTEYIMCEEETGWDKEFEECVESICDPPEPLVNGTIPEIESSNMTVYPFNFELTYICDKGFKLIGDNWRFCDSSGWSGKSPSCERYYDFENDTKVEDFSNKGFVETKAKQKQKLKEYHKVLAETWRNGTKAMPIEPEEGINLPERNIFYFAFDVSSSIEEKNFKKGIEFAKAFIKNVGISENGSRAGALTFSGVAKSQFFPRQYKTTEDVLAAFDYLKFTGGTTATNSALAHIREKFIPITQAWLQEKGMKSIIFIITDGKYSKGRDPNHEAEILKKAGVEIYCIGITDSVANDSFYKIASEPKEDHVFNMKRYSNVSYLAEEIIYGTIDNYCPAPGTPVNGAKNSSSYDMGDKVHFRCYGKYTLVGSEIRECLPSGEWSGEEAKCFDYSKCGMDPEKFGKKGVQEKVVGGREATNPWPWMAALYLIRPHLQLEFLGGGSIIHKRFILTAAHCLYIENSKIGENEITVKLGLTNVKNQSFSQEFEIKKILIHPSYRFGLINDYDIALLQLKRPMKFNELIRPICLPPRELSADTNFYKPGEFVVAIGWGHTEVVGVGEGVNVNSNDQLKEIFLPIQSSESCRSSDHSTFLSLMLKNIVSERMFCAGDGRGGNDTCYGDSGGPSMQSQLNEDGDMYWTQVGIVSWGPGCGVAKTYGYYTHVQKFMDWVTSNIPSKN